MKYYNDISTSFKNSNHFKLFKESTIVAAKISK